MLPDIEGFLIDLSNTLGAWTYLLVAGTGLSGDRRVRRADRPGETAIVLGGVVASSGRVSLPVVIAIAWVFAFLGDLASFWLGRRLGRKFVYSRSWLPVARVEQVEGFYLRHGAKAIFVGRFIGLVRAVSPFLAGASGLSLRGFVPWSLLGTLRVGDRVHAARLRRRRVGDPRGHLRRLRPGGDRGGRARLARPPSLAVANSRRLDPPRTRASRSGRSRRPRHARRSRDPAGS